MGCLCSRERSEDDGVDTVISIDDIVRGDKGTLSILKKCLVARGWVKVRFSKQMNETIKDAMANINEWLDETEETEKLKFSRKLENGDPNPQSEYSYNAINGFKEGLRVLTADLYTIHQKNNKYPIKISADILKINETFDQLSYDIMKKVYSFVYHLSDYKEFGTIYDISLLNEKMKFSMLDFVKYYNDEEFIQNIRKSTETNELKPNVLKTEFNVFEHTDPGLFALSFGSTNEGLEMYDSVQKEWIKIGLNESVWWNGNTSTKVNSDIKAGKHRIMINENYKPRFTGWYEVSCNKQLKEYIKKEAQSMMQKDDLKPFVFDESIAPDDAFLIEYDSGVPMSKALI